MQITLLAVGTRGDVQPYLALGVGFQRAGHAVRLAAPTIYETWIRGYGLGFAPLRFNPQDLLKRPDIQRAIKSRNTIGTLLTLARAVGPSYRTQFDDFWRATQGTDVIVAAATAHGAYDCAEKLGVPFVLALLQPMVPTRAFPSFLLPPGPRLGGAYNRLTHLLVEQGISWLMPRWLVPWRKQVLGLPPWPFSNLYAHLRARRVPMLLGYSPTVVPKPPDWGDWNHVTGYWFLDPPPGWQPPAALAAFLQSGPPSVYIGFGSMSDENPQALTQMALDALELSGQRGILASGWSGLGEAELPHTVFCIDSIPHTWLLPQMAASVHHGGAGTTGASLRAGVPSIITPFSLDQFAWANAVVALGAGPKMPAIKKLTADKLASAITTAMSDMAMRRRAAELGAQIQAEDGVAQAVKVVQEYVSSWK